MEKIALLESYILKIKSKERNKIENNSIIDLLNELSELDPKCLSKADYDQIIRYLPLSPRTYNNQILAAGCNTVASLCSDDLARHYFGEVIIVSIVNILKTIKNHRIKDKTVKKCLIQACRAIGNLCYYHEENTKYAIREGCLTIAMEVLKLTNDKNFQTTVIALLLNLTHLIGYNFELPENMINDLNSFGLKYMENDNNNHKLYINLVSIMINVMRMRHIRGVGEFDRCSIINSLMEKYFTHIGINFICVKFIKTISKIFDNYNWIMNTKYKLLVQILDNYENNQEEEVKRMVKKVCDIVILISDDDGSLDDKYRLKVLYLVEWLLLKIYSKNVCIKLSAVRSLANFSRYKYESNNIIINHVKLIKEHMPWLLKTLETSTYVDYSIMQVSILSLFKNILYVTNFESMDENYKKQLISITMNVLIHNPSYPVIVKGLYVIVRIINAGGISKKLLVTYKNEKLIQVVAKHCNDRDEAISVWAIKLLNLINAMNVSENISLSVKNLKINDKS